MLSKSKTQPVPLGTVIYQDDPAVAKFDVGKRDKQRHNPQEKNVNHDRKVLKLTEGKL